MWLCLIDLKYKPQGELKVQLEGLGAEGDELCVPSGMIRLPKASKPPLKNKPVPRQSLATIVKDLGEEPDLSLSP